MLARNVKFTSQRIKCPKTTHRVICLIRTHWGKDPCHSNGCPVACPPLDTRINGINPCICFSPQLFQSAGSQLAIIALVSPRARVCSPGWLFLPGWLLLHGHAPPSTAFPRTAYFLKKINNSSQSPPRADPVLPSTLKSSHLVHSSSYQFLVSLCCVKRLFLQLSPSSLYFSPPDHSVPATLTFSSCWNLTGKCPHQSFAWGGSSPRRSSSVRPPLPGLPFLQMCTWFTLILQIFVHLAPSLWGPLRPLNSRLQAEPCPLQPGHTALLSRVLLSHTAASPVTVLRI